MDKRIKILYTIPNFDTAGSGKVVYDLANNLDSSKFEIEIACQHNRGKFFKEVEALGFPIHIMETNVPYRPYFSLISRLKSIIKFFKNNDYDIIHSWHWSSDWTEALAARLAGVKWVYTKKAMSWGSRHWKIRSFMADFIVTINDEMKNYFPNKKAQKLIPIGIDTDYYKPSTAQTIKDSKTFKIVTVANLVAVKGIEILINAVHLMKDDTVRLKVVGGNDNEYGEFLMDLCKELHLEDKVEFTGKVLDVRPLIEEADVYVMPTKERGEGFGVALVEAMCMAVPVLGSNVSGINYILKEYPEFLFPAGNSHALMEQLIHFRNMDPLKRKNIGYSLREYCMNHFSIQSFIAEHEKLYNSLA